jgi:hypothetical protein
VTRIASIREIGVGLGHFGVVFRPDRSREFVNGLSGNGRDHVGE